MHNNFNFIYPIYLSQIKKRKKTKIQYLHVKS